MVNWYSDVCRVFNPPAHAVLKMIKSTEVTICEIRIDEKILTLWGF